MSAKEAWTGPALALLFLFATAEATQIHVEVRRQTWSVSLSELPLVLGLFLLPPPVLLVVRLIPAAGVFLLRRTNPSKAVFNLGLFAAEVGTASWVFGLLGATSGLRPTDWAVAYLSTVTAVVLGACAVFVAVALIEGRFRSDQLVSALAPGTLTAGLNTTAALLALLVLDVDGGIVLLALLLIPITIAYRAYNQLQRQHTDLGQLFAFTQEVGAAGSREQLVTQLLDRARVLLNAEKAELLTVTADTSTSPATATVIPRGTRDPLLRSVLGRTQLRDALMVRLQDEGQPGLMLRIGNRVGAMSTFTDADLRLLQTFATHAEAVLHNRRLLEQARYDAHHDGLTGMANRSLFLLRLGERLATCTAQPPRHLGGQEDSSGQGEPPVEAAVLMLDLDRFKDVNDSLGHHVGDLLLREVATRLQAALHPGILAARLGGDEFALLIEHCRSRQEATDVALSAQQALTGPFEVAGTVLEIGGSIGVALIPSDGRDPAAVLQHADIAMYAAKRLSVGVSHYRRDDDLSSRRRLALAGDMRHAVGGDQFIVYYQPKMCLSRRIVTGCEALVRWQHPERGLLAPDEFIPLAEQTGLIGPITEEVLRQSLFQCAQWLPMHPQVGVAVNLSARALLDPGLHSMITAALDESQVPAELLTLEITESSVMGDFDAALAVLLRLRELGVQLSVDDFGTGYSSLSYLQRLPVQEVKIDKSFVIPMGSSASAVAIVRSVIELAHTLKLSVVAEGVEDETAQAALAALGCDTIQGFLLSRPVPIDQLRLWLQAAATASRDQHGQSTATMTSTTRSKKASTGASR